MNNDDLCEDFILHADSDRLPLSDWERGFVMSNKRYADECVKKNNPIRFSDKQKSIILRMIAEHDESFYLTARIIPKAHKLRQAINDAICSKSTLFIEYESISGERSERRIRPIAWMDAMKFEAYCYLRAGNREFRLDRIMRFTE